MERQKSNYKLKSCGSDIYRLCIIAINFFPVTMILNVLMLVGTSRLISHRILAVRPAANLLSCSHKKILTWLLVSHIFLKAIRNIVKLMTVGETFPVLAGGIRRNTPENCSYEIVSLLSFVRGGRVVRCQTCDRKVMGSTPARGCCVPTPTQRAILRGRLMSSRLWDEGLVRLIEAVVCLSCCVSRCRYHYLMPISCHFQDCKVLLFYESSHVSSSLSSTRTFIFTFAVQSNLSSVVFFFYFYSCCESIFCYFVLVCSLVVSI